MRCSRLALALALALTLPACPSDAGSGGPGGPGTTASTEAAPSRAVPDTPWLVGAPGETVSFTAQAVDDDDQPVAGVAIAVGVPVDGPTATLGTARRDGATVAEQVTDADGRITVELTLAEAAGSFLVELRTAGHTAQSTVAVSVTDAPLAADPGVLRSEVEADHPDATVHGPLWLPAGTTLREAGIPGAADDLPLATDSWFVLADPNPLALAEHAHTWLVAPDEAGATLTAHDRHGLPVAFGPDDEAWLLLPPIAASGDDPYAPSFATSQATTARGALPPPAMEPGACALVFAGGPEGRHGESIGRVVEQALIPRVGEDRVIHSERSNYQVTRPEVEELIQRAGELDCDKLYVFIHGHGSQTYPMPGVTTMSEDLHDDHQWTTYDELAGWFVEYLDTEQTELCVVVNSCHAERAVQLFQGRGLRGRILVSSRHEEPSESWAGWGSFLKVLVEEWNDDASDADGDGVVSLGEAYQAGDTLARSEEDWDYDDEEEYWLNRWQQAMPQDLPISPEPDGLEGVEAPEVITVGDSGELLIPRPEFERYSHDPALATDFIAEVEIAGTGLTSDLGADATITFPDDMGPTVQREATLELIGLFPGVYQVTVRYLGRNRVYETTLEVEVVLPEAPEPVEQFVPLDHSPEEAIPFHWDGPTPSRGSTSPWAATIADDAGFSMVDLFTGQVLYDYHSGPPNPTYGAVPLLDPANPDALDVLWYGPSTMGVTSLGPAGFGFSLINIGTYGGLDAVAVGDDPLSGEAVHAGFDGVGFVSEGGYGLSFSDELTFGTRHSAFAEELGGPVLTVVPGAPGELRMHSGRPQGTSQVALELGDDPRRVRCSQGVCAATNHGSDSLTVFTWDGEGLPVYTDTVTVGQGPVGLDLLPLSGGGVAAVITGYYDDTVTVTELDASGGVVDSITEPVGMGCVAPGFAVWFDTHLVVTCSGADGYALLVDRAP